MTVKTDAQLGSIFVEAMKIWDAQKADGVSLMERSRGLEQTIRAAWPFTREWKFLCQQCDDRGLVMGTCPGIKHAICGRERPHPPHEFGTPCGYCEHGRKFRPKQRPTGDDAVTAAASVRKPTRMGR